MAQEKIDYYSVGNRNDIVISNGLFTAINPEQGGSPQKALDFLDRSAESEETKSLENGKLLHKYCEQPDAFAVAEVPRPSDMLGDMIDEFHRLSASYSDQSTGDIEIVSKLKSDNGRAAEIAITKASFEKLAGLLQYTYNPTVLLFREARKNKAAYKSYNEGTLVEKFISEGLDYLKELNKLDGKIALTKDEKFVIESAKNSLYSNLLINKYWNLGKRYDNNPIFKELEVYFEVDLYGIKLKGKAKLDNVYIDVENKTIYLNDLKTTSKPLGLFKNALEYYRYYRQLAWYKKALIEYIKANMPQYIGWKIVCQIAAVETIGSFQSCIFDVEEYIMKGTMEAQALCNRIHYHQKNNIWDMSMEQHKGNGVIKLIPDKNDNGN